MYQNRKNPPSLEPANTLGKEREERVVTGSHFREKGGKRKNKVNCVFEQQKKRRKRKRLKKNTGKIFP